LPHILSHIRMNSSPAPGNFSQDTPRKRAIRLHNLRAAASNLMAQNTSPNALMPGRWTRRQWLHASLVATLLVLTASIVPGFSGLVVENNDAPALTTLSLPLPPLSRVRPEQAAGTHWEEVTVEPGQTLVGIFTKIGAPQPVLQKILAHSGVRESLAKLHPGVKLGFQLTEDGVMSAFRFDRSDSERVHLVLGEDGQINEHITQYELETRTVLVSGTVGRSLFHSARKLGLAGHVINALTDDIFQYDIDFSRDMTANDRFSVLVEQTWRDGELIRTGPVQAAVFTAKGRPFTALRFEHEGKAGYFDTEGRPLKKSFIRNPIQFARLSSRFGMRRHPVLGTMRAHKGVDYAAPTGTPIMAAGDAKVVSVGWKGGYGNAVVLDHGRGYTTLYGHMSRTAKLHRGQRVRQGEVIGYVGATGMATGPHLHYEFRINGVHRDPLKHTLPPPEPLNGDSLLAFRVQSTPTLERMREIEDVIFAQLQHPEIDQAFAVNLRPEEDEG